jgi:hypothetical protein
MTASPGREVDGNLLLGAAPGSAQALADPHDAGSQNFADLVEALGGGHEVRMEGLGQGGVGSARVHYCADVAHAGASAR